MKRNVVRCEVYSVRCEVTDDDYLYEIAAVSYLISLKNDDVCLYAVTISVTVTETEPEPDSAAPP
jgi:hypothetical protein